MPLQTFPEIKKLWINLNGYDAAKIIANNEFYDIFGKLLDGLVVAKLQNTSIPQHVIDIYNNENDDHIDDYGLYTHFDTTDGFMEILKLLGTFSVPNDTGVVFNIMDIKWLDGYYFVKIEIVDNLYE